MSNWHLSATCLPLPCIIQTTCRPEHVLQPLSHLDPAVTPVMVCRACDIVITVDATRSYEPACRPAIFHRKLTYVSRSFRPRESRHGSQENSRLFGIMALVSDFWLELGVPQSLRNHSATESPAWPTFGGQHADLSTGSVQLREDFTTAVENQSYMVYSALALAYHMKERIQGYES